MARNCGKIQADCLGSTNSLLKLIKDVPVRGNDVPGVDRACVRKKTFDKASSLPNDQSTGGKIPRLEAMIPVPVKAASSDIGQIQGGRWAAEQIAKVAVPKRLPPMSQA